MVTEISLSLTKYNEFMIKSDYNIELINIIKSFKGCEWNPSTKEWILHIKYYHEFKEKVSQFKIVKDLTPYEVDTRCFVVENHPEFLLVQNNETVSEILINLIKNFDGYFCKFKNGWVIKKKTSSYGNEFLGRIEEIGEEFAVKRISKNKFVFYGLFFQYINLQGHQRKHTGVTRIEFKKHDNGILISLKDFDYKVIEKIKSLKEKKYIPEQKAWLVGKQHEKELRNHFVLPHFLITE